MLQVNLAHYSLGDVAAIWNIYVPRPVSNLSQTFGFLALEGEELWKEKPRKTESEYVKIDVSNCGLDGIDPQDRDACRAVGRHSPVLPTP